MSIDDAWDEKKDNIEMFWKDMSDTTMPKDFGVNSDAIEAGIVEPDAILSPAYYSKGNVECINGIKSSMSKEAFKGYLKGNVLKYVWRYEDKGKPSEDLHKAMVYLGWLIDEVEE